MDTFYDKDIEKLFPNLKTTGYRVTSPDSPLYNCIAWVFEDSLNWWEPTPFVNYYWPKEIPKQNSVKTYAQLLHKFGFIKCNDGKLEKGYQKIAIYINAQDTPTHLARQLKNGEWTSKIGTIKDIVHNNLKGLEGKEYGIASFYFKRKFRKNNN